MPVTPVIIAGKCCQKLSFHAQKLADVLECGLGKYAEENQRPYPIEYVPDQRLTSELRELVVPPNCAIVDRAIVDMELPAELLIVLIARGQDFIVPNGNMVVRPGDKLLVLSERDVLILVQEQFSITESACVPNVMGASLPEQD